MLCSCQRLTNKYVLAARVALCRIRRAPSSAALCHGNCKDEEGEAPLVNQSESDRHEDRHESSHKSTTKTTEPSSWFETCRAWQSLSWNVERDEDSDQLPSMETVRRRLTSREGWLEIFGFVAWKVVVCLHVSQLFALWWFFWQYVAEQQYDIEKQPISKLAYEGIAVAAKGTSALAGTLARRAVHRSVASSRARRAAAFAAWAGWLGFGVLVERPLLKRLMPGMIFSLCYHAELFGAAGLAMTLCTNFASYLHSPGKRLFDVGFAIVPEIPRHSWLHSLSDAMTGLVPIVTFVYLCLILDRRRRTRAMTDWFRMMTIVYCFRCITATMTSLPGPAPHCGKRAYREGNYMPPGSWHDIATSLTSAASGGSCGDLLFSGHAAMTTITTLLLVRQQRRHGHKAEKVAKVVGCTYIVLVCLFALASRKHYSVDLALGTLIGSLTYFRFRDSWSRDPVSLDRMEQVARYYSPRHESASGHCKHCTCPSRHNGFVPREDYGDDSSILFAQHAHHIEQSQKTSPLDSKPVARIV